LRGLSDPEIIESSKDLITDKEHLKWAEKRKIQPGQRFNEDPSHYRIGIILNE